LAGQVGFLTAQLATAHERLVALEMPAPTESSVSAPGAAEATDPITEPSAPDEPVSAPWWRRWLGTAYGW
jgi:hypothetical protein